MLPRNKTHCGICLEFAQFVAIYGDALSDTLSFALYIYALYIYLYSYK